MNTRSYYINNVAVYKDLLILRKGSHFWLVMASHDQPRAGLPRLTTYAFGWFGFMARSKTVQNKSLVTFDKCFFLNLMYLMSSYKPKCALI